MRTSLRLFTAAVCTATAAAFLGIIPASPAGAVAQLHTVSVGSTSISEGDAGSVEVTLNGSPLPGETITVRVKSDDTAPTASTNDYTPVDQTLYLRGGPDLQDSADPDDRRRSRPSRRKPFESQTIVSAERRHAGQHGLVTITNDDGGTVRPSRRRSAPTPTATAKPMPTTTVHVNVNLSAAAGDDVYAQLRHGRTAPPKAGSTSRPPGPAPLGVRPRAGPDKGFDIPIIKATTSANPTSRSRSRSARTRTQCFPRAATDDHRHPERRRRGAGHHHRSDSAEARGR